MEVSSESSSDDEEICRLMEAVAPSFKMDPSHNRFKSDKSNGKQGCAHAVSKESYMNHLVKPKTKRTDLKEVDKKWNSGHFESVDVSTETQSFIAKKLSAALDKQLDEQIQDMIEPFVISPHTDEPEANGILLFSNSKFKFTSADFDKGVDIPENAKRKRLNIDKIRSRKRKLVDSQDSDDEQTKLKSVAVTSDWVHSAS